jgi:hypothetical protein
MAIRGAAIKECIDTTVRPLRRCDRASIDALESVVIDL